MSSADAAKREERASVTALLDVAVGFGVWAVHLVAIYAATSIACVLGLYAADGAARNTFLVAALVFTALTALVVVAHALRRWRSLRDIPDQRFRMGVILGCDAIALVAILWQVFPFLIAPVCN